MPSALMNDLKPASFRGMPIWWRDQKGNAGRRLAEHEYPQRDKPYIEDMGRVMRVLSMSAVILGKDWQEKLNKLLGLLEKPGPGELVHPLFGALKVYARPCEWTTSLEQGGRVDLSLEFIEAGDLAFPQPTVNKAKATLTAADQLKARITDRFAAAMAMVNQGHVMLEQVKSQVNNVLGPVMAAVNGAVALVGGIDTLLSAALMYPAGIANQLFGAFDQLRDPFGMTSRSFDRLTSAFRLSGSSAGELSVRKLAGASANAMVVNAITDLLVGVLLVDALKTAASLPVLASKAGDAVALPAASLESQAASVAEPADIPVADDILSARDELAGALWDAALTADASTVMALQVARQAGSAHLSAVAQQGIRLTRFTPPAVLPALVLAYRQHGDATRADELLRRNRIKHPLFVPATSLQIATT